MDHACMIMAAHAARHGRAACMQECDRTCSWIWTRRCRAGRNRREAVRRRNVDRGIVVYYTDTWLFRVHQMLALHVVAKLLKLLHGVRVQK